MTEHEEMTALRGLLHTIGLPHTSVAKWVGISDQYFNRILLGRENPSAPVRNRIREIRRRLIKSGLAEFATGTASNQ